MAGTALAYSKTLMPSAHHVLGVGLVIQGRPQDAIGELRTYLRLAPQASNAGPIREHLKLLELQRRQRLRGLHCSQIALDIGPAVRYFFMYKSAIAQQWPQSASLHASPLYVERGRLARGIVASC